MNHVLPSRRIVALIAAYVVALQALLLPLSVVAATPDFSLCAAATSASAQHPGGGHANGCPCAAGCGTQCCVNAIAGPPETIVILAPLSLANVAPMPAAALDARPYRHSPQLARAPPTV